ncbi:MAG: type II secretion system protein [Deltaproteobacteria bacterium]|nr:type II secretion system protein [Deltaproteobacteria bacterium]
MVEVILTIVVLGILATVALPNFVAVSDEAQEAARDNVVAVVQTSIDLWRVEDIVSNGPPGNYPAGLDAQPDNTVCGPATPCFGTVLMSPVTDGRWSKQSATQYRYTGGNGSVDFTYSAVNGTFGP